jgi:hypothetical protein
VNRQISVAFAALIVLSTLFLPSVSLTKLTPNERENVGGGENKWRRLQQ